MSTPKEYATNHITAAIKAEISSVENTDRGDYPPGRRAKVVIQMKKRYNSIIKKWKLEEKEYAVE